MLTGMFRIISVIGLALVFIQCGPSGKEAQVEFSLEPREPVVITGSTEVRDQIIPGPWFSFSVKVTNNSDTPVTIVGLEILVSARNKGNALIENETSSSASNFNFTIANGDDSCSYEFDTFDTIESGDSKHLTISDFTPEGGDSCSGLIGSIARFYIGSNPNKDEDNVRNYNYKVKLTPLGWFGSSSEPLDRFEKSIRFNTQ